MKCKKIAWLLLLCRLCVWSLSAPAGHSLLLEFDHLDLENGSNCQYDRLTVLVGTNRPVGEFVRTSAHTHTHFQAAPLKSQCVLVS